MNKLTFGVAALLSGLVLADAGTQPTTASSDKKFPTPAELVAKMRASAAERATLLQVAHFNLNEAISEKPSEFSFFGADTSTLRSLLDRLRAAREDAEIRAVLITINGGSMNLAQAHEVRDELIELRRTGKKVFIYADSYDLVAYSVAAGASNICLMEGGELMIPGVGLETMFYRGTLDKIGVQPDYIQIGEYKGAEEPYTRTTPSDELRGELNRLTESLFAQLIEGISTARGVSREQVRSMIDDTMLSAQTAKDRGFVDHIIDQDGLRELVKNEIGGEIDLVKDYGKPEKDEFDFSNPWALLASLSKQPEESDRDAIALIYAEGVIVDGEAAPGLMDDGGVGSEPIRRAMRSALRDDKIKAVVIRIDSPGGSALASEVMWQATRRVAAKKPVIISIGSMAASGGYYLASAGDYIFADPIGIVGSIGVVGGKFVLKDLYAKVGLTTESFQKGQNAGLFSSNEPWNDQQKRMVRTWMQQTYDQFTKRVMTTRTGKIRDIDKVARGRIFLAKEAKELGMVDELGGTLAAINHAADKSGLVTGEYDIRVLPAPKTIADYLTSNFDADARLPIKVNISADSILRVLPKDVRRAVSQQIQMLQLLEQRPVILAAPITIRLR